MKRRQSARPVVVEIKRTRNSPLASSINSRRSQPYNSLWRNTALHEATAEASREAHQVIVPDFKAGDPTPQPARRVLPSLIPMHATSEPQQDERRVERKQRSDRAKPAQKMQPSPVAQPNRRASAARKEAMASQEALDARVEITPPHSHITHVQSPPKRAIPSTEVGRVRGHRDQKLRRGEFWKRRLPRACW